MTEDTDNKVFHEMLDVFESAPADDEQAKRFAKLMRGIISAPNYSLEQWEAFGHIDATEGNPPDFTDDTVDAADELGTAYMKGYTRGRAEKS